MANNKLFRFAEVGSQGANTGKDPTRNNTSKLGSGPALIPGPDGGLINILKDFPWTLTPNSSPALDEVPYIYLTEYRYLQNQFIAQATTLQNAASFFFNQGEADPYKGLYDLDTPSYFKYIIPYFNTNQYDINSSWTSVDAGLPSAKAIAGGITATVGAVAGSSAGGVGAAIGGNVGQQVGNLVGGLIDTAVLANVMKDNPKVGIIDSPKLWKNTNERSYTVEFPLYNTLNEKDIQKNWELCYLLTYQNLFNKKTYFTAIPPVYYEVYIPGIHYSKASYVSNLKIQNIGNIRKLKRNWGSRNEVDYLIPDCYVVSVTLQDLLMPSQNQHFEASNSRISTSTAAGNPYAVQLEKDIRNKQFTPARDIVDAVKDLFN
jgi:hypothetical protein